MTWLEGLILGIIQGLTEFLPVSSSGHLEIGKAMFGIHSADSMTFTIVVHAATVLSIIVVFWKDIKKLLISFFSFKSNEENKYTLKLLLSAVPVIIVGLLWQDKIEGFFTGNLLLVGSMLLLTSILLFWAHYAKDGKRQINFLDAFIIGIAQAIAVMPGISRSGATISTALIIGNKKQEVAKFSFLMVVIPVLGAIAKDIMDNFITHTANSAENIGIIPLAVGFLAAFLTGVLACNWMIKLVKNSKLIYFAIYTLIVGAVAVIYSLTAV